MSNETSCFTCIKKDTCKHYQKFVDAFNQIIELQFGGRYNESKRHQQYLGIVAQNCKFYLYSNGSKRLSRNG